MLAFYYGGFKGQDKLEEWMAVFYIKERYSKRGPDLE
jgi:hypothetical protein